MRRSVTVTLGAFLLLAVGALLWKGGGAASPIAATADAGTSGTVALGAAGAPQLDGGLLDDPFLANLLAPPDAGGAEPPTETEPGARPLPTGAPKLVRFGVILVQYRGAQGAPPTSRSRDEAATLARSLSEGAKGDFRAQVAKGDPGSMDDAGRIPRGVLEPTTEYTLFTMSKGDVSEPLDTPRGFWIVKRID